MAENAVKLVAGKLETLLSREACLLLGVEDQIKSLRVKLLWIQSFLRDAEEKRRDNERTKAWVGLMREIVYDAEDVIDQYFLRIELRQRRRSFITRPIGWMKEIPTLHILGKKMENINTRFQEIVACKSHFGIEDMPTEVTSSSRPSESHLPRRRSYLQETEVHPVGLEDAVESLTKRLTDEVVTRRAVISIVGMGGSGKSTLASRVYNSADVKNHFQSRVWISLSQNFNEKVLLRGIIEGFMEKQPEEKEMDMVKEKKEKKEMDKLNEDQLATKIQDLFKERKYLLVVDDIWEIEAWDCIKRALADTHQGGRVMLTTRIIDIAKYADPESDPYEMQTLDEKRSWELFCAKALLDAKCLDKLEPIGRKIVSMCKGLPLAIVVIGGLLRRKMQDLDAWQKVHNRIHIILSEEGVGAHGILSLSYDDLPQHLKPCFLYLALFPEDCVIDADRLIRLWIAEGFIQQKQNLTMEEVAEDYLEDLINRSMIQLVSRNDFGDVMTIRIHDLLLHIALSESKEINFLDVYDENRYFDPSSDSRRLAIHSSHIREYNSLNLSTPKLRSLLYTGQASEFEDVNFCHIVLILFIAAAGLLACQHPLRALGRGIVKTLIPNAPFPYHGSSKLLRVIDLEGLALVSLPEEIGDMIQLRYLGLKDTLLRNLPSSVGNLNYLQTLDIRNTLIEFLPKAFWKIQTLRHVFLEEDFFRGKPKVVGRWNDLRTLEGIRCGSWMRSGLAKIRNLCHLGMTRVSRADADTLVPALQALGHLVSLKLQGKSLPVKVFTLSTHQHLYKLDLSGPLDQKLCHNDKQLSLQNLRRLVLRKSGLEKDDITILAKLPELRFLKLLNQSYKGKELCFAKDGFPKLEELVLGWLQELEILEVEQGSLTSLRELSMYECEKLGMLPEGIQHLTTLTSLEVSEMSTIVGRMKVNDGEDYNKIKHVRSIVVDQEPLPNHKPTGGPGAAS